MVGLDRARKPIDPLGAAVLDVPFTGLEPEADGLVRVTLASPEGPGLGVWMGPGTTHVMVYTGEAIGRAGLAVEPMSCPPNAFQTGEDVRVLAPGEAWAFSWGVEIPP